MNIGPVTAVMPLRFEGSPDTMQGGYLAGLAAGPMGGTVRVQIRRPVRPGAEIAFSTSQDGERLGHLDDALALKAFHDAIRIDQSPVLTGAEITDVMSRPRPFELPFPTCAGCGDRHDGLGADLRPLGNRMLGRWTPAAEGDDSVWPVPLTHIWTVIDCLTSWALFADPPADRSGHYVTGNIAVEIRRPIEPGRAYRMQSWRARDVEPGTFKLGSVIVGGTIEDDDGIVAFADQELVRTANQGMTLDPT